MTLHITKEISDAFSVYNSVIDHDSTGKPITLKEVYSNLSIVDFAAGCQAAPQPPAYVPLSDAEIEALDCVWLKDLGFDGCEVDQASVMRFARAIEQAVRGKV